METAKIRIRVYNGLQSFLDEIPRPGHYIVKVKNDKKIEVYHHSGKWMLTVTPRKAVVYTDEDILEVTKVGMTLNGQEIISICDTRRCYSAEDIILKIVTAVALAGIREPWLYRWVK